MVMTCSKLSSKWTFLGMLGAVLMCRMARAASVERRILSLADSLHARPSPSTPSWSTCRYIVYTCKYTYTTHNYTVVCFWVGWGGTWNVQRLIVHYFHYHRMGFKCLMIAFSKFRGDCVFNYCVCRMWPATNMYYVRILYCGFKDCNLEKNSQFAIFRLSYLYKTCPMVTLFATVCTGTVFMCSSAQSRTCLSRILISLTKLSTGIWIACGQTERQTDRSRQREKKRLMLDTCT